MRWISVIMLSLGLLSAAGADAAMIHKNWKNAGDQLVSYEQESNLDWLKLSATGGKTWRYVSNNLQSEFAGWRFPTYSEVKLMAERLLGQARLQQVFSGGPSIDLTKVEDQNWYQAMGRTDSSTASFGLVLNDKQQVFGVGLFPGGNFNNLQYSSTAVDGHAHTYFTGIYLVRDAVADVAAPAPLAGLMLLLGLFLRRQHKPR